MTEPRGLVAGKAVLYLRVFPLLKMPLGAFLAAAWQHVVSLHFCRDVKYERIGSVRLLYQWSEEQRDFLPYTLSSTPPAQPLPTGNVLGFHRGITAAEVERARAPITAEQASPVTTCIAVRVVLDVTVPHHQHRWRS